MRKLIPAILVSAILVLTLSSVAFAADNPKKPITPPQLKNITFIHYAKPDVPPGQNKDKPQPPDVDNSAYELLGLYLPNTASYYINTSGAPSGTITALDQSFDTWDRVTGEELFTSAGQTPVYGLALDGQNTVSWVGIVPPSTIAMTRLWYNESNEIVEFDIVFNALLKWGIDPDGEGPIKLKRAYDIQNIATHEVGHVVGLDDLYEDQYRELTMYGYGKTGEVIKISLEEGDIAGAQCLYGSP
jgi:hypothetical protein